MSFAFSEPDLIDNLKLIEKTLKLQGIVVKVMKVNGYIKYFEYFLELAEGTNLEELEKHGRDLALVLASPSGKVEWQIPVPGTKLVSLKIPKPTKDDIEKKKLEEKETVWEDNRIRNTIALIFFLIGQAFYWISYKILGKQKTT